MSELSSDAAYLIENGVPEDEVLAMPPGKQAAMALVVRHKGGKLGGPGTGGGATNLTADVAYLIKNGLPYERAVAMSASELKAAIKTMQRVERRSPADRFLSAFAGIILIAIGLGMLALLLPILGVMFSH